MLMIFVCTDSIFAETKSGATIGILLLSRKKSNNQHSPGVIKHVNKGILVFNVDR